MIPGRHEDDCEVDGCRGCLPCTEAHCRVCGMAHADGTCGECLAEVRTNLSEIRRMWDSLPEEVQHRGVEGEAMNLLGPVVDPEARGYWEASVLGGRIVPIDCDARDLDAVKTWLGQQADHEQHPLWVLGTWRMVWEDALEHTSDEVLEVDTAAGYLDRQLTYMAGYEDVPFEDFARDLRKCVNHLELVLHDGEQVDRGVPCMTCARPLVRVWGSGQREDGWECKRCRTTSTEAQYQLAVKADYLERAEWLTDVDMTLRTGIKAGTVRSWARSQENSPPLVRKKRDQERTVYCVEDVQRIKAERRAA